MRDPYEVLGVARGASAAEIKSAFRKLAKKHRIRTPTRTIRRRPARFSELNAAYEILGDDEKRKAFDRGEIDAEGKPRFQGFEGFGPGAGGGGGREGAFETFSCGPDGFQRSGGGRRVSRLVGGGGFEDILKDMFGGRAARAARAGPGGFSSSRRMPPQRAAISPPRSPSRWRRPPRAPRSGCICRPARTSTSKSRRASPRASRSGSRARAGGPARPRRRCADHGDDGAASVIHARRCRPSARSADHALRGGAGRQGAGADARRRGRARHPGRHQFRPHLPAQGQGVSEPRNAPAI